MIRIWDQYRIQPDKRFENLSKSDRIRMMDSVLNVEDASKRGLEVTFGLSNAGRRINNRIYSPRSQERQAVTGIGKPITKNHQTRDVDEIVGRLTSVKYNPLDSVAMQFFKDGKDFMQFKRVLDAYNPAEVYKELVRHNLLTNDSWQGISELEAKALITDEGAIEKFLNGTYMDFSGGALPSAWICSHCMQDWYREGPCAHKPGSIIKGQLVVNIIDGYEIDEASIVFKGANKFSKVRHLQMTDSAGAELHLPDGWDEAAESDIYITDSEITFPATDAVVKEELMDPKELADALLPLLKDALVTQIVEQVKAELQSAVEDTVEVADTTEVTDNDVIEDAQTQEALVEPEAQAEPEVQDSSTTVDTVEDSVEIPWKLLDMAFGIELADAQLSTEKRNDLPDSAFCGPDRSFPVHDCAHVTAARRLIGRADLTDAQKQRVLACVDSKAESLGCEVEDGAKNCRCGTYDSLATDYANALRQIEDLREEIQRLKSEDSTQELDTATGTADNDGDQVNVVRTTETIQRVEDESVASTEDAPDVHKLTDFEMNIIAKYKTIRDSEGPGEADNYLRSKMRRKHLPRTFDITPFLEEN